jgi:hypothetical protein
MNYFNIKQHKSKIRLLIVCLIIIGISAITVNAQSKADSCYVVPKGDGLLIQVSKSDGQESVIGALGTDKVQAIAFNATIDTLFGAQIGRLGIIDINTGNFTALSMSYGSGNGTLGLIDFVQVEGLTYDALSKELLGTVKVEGSDDILFKINPATGAHIPDAFGTGVDYVTISGPGVLPIAEDLAIDPTTGVLYAFSRETVGNDLLITVDKTTGAANVVGPLGENIIEGLGFDLEGRLFATPGAQTSPPSRFYEINKSNGKATTIAVLTVSRDYESCDCLTTPYEVNRSPNAEGDTFETKVNQVLMVDAPGVLENDSDPDGDELIIIDYDSTSRNGGKVELDVNGGFTYTPPDAFVGIDEFEYIVSDSTASDTATVNQHQY